MSSSERKQEEDKTSATTPTTPTTPTTSLSSPPPQMTPTTGGEGQMDPPIKDIVVLYMKEQASACEQRIYKLQQTEFTADSIECTEKESFTQADLLRYNRIEVLVDEAMYNLLMQGEELDSDVKVKFKELDNNGKIVYVSNNFQDRNDLCDQLFYRLPRKTRRRFEGSQSKENVTPGVMPSGTNVGMTGGAAHDSIVAGTVGGNVHKTIYQYNTYETSKAGSVSTFRKRRSTAEYDTDKVSNKLRISIDCAEKESSFYLTLTENKYHLQTQGVKGVEIAQGSIIITLTIEDGFKVTDNWIQAMLATIFDDILGTCTAEGETFLVHVEGQVTITEALTDPFLHENCISRQEHSKRVKELEKQVEVLQKEKETIMEEDLKEAKLMLYMKHSTTHGDHVKDTDVSSDSGFTPSTSASQADNEHEAQKEEILPAEPSMCEVQDGSATLIYFNRNKMLHEACRNGHLQVVRSLLSAGRVDINSRGEDGVSPVMIAAWNGYGQVFDLLVKSGCDLSAQLDNGNNILHVACFGGNVEIVDYIVTNRVVDIDSRGMYGRTAVMKAASMGQKKVFDQLVSKRCNLSVVDDGGDNILHVACLGGSVEMVDFLITHKQFDIEKRGKYGWTPVMIAANMGQKKMFDLLVSKGCKMSVVDDEGDNILHVACMGDSVELVDFLITHKQFDIEKRGKYGWTPVMLAANKGQKKVFDLLVSKGCVISVVDDEGDNILHVACMGGSVEIVDFLITHKQFDIEKRGECGRTPVMIAANMGQKKVFDLLVSKRCNLSVVDDQGYNILHVSAIGGNVSIVRYILTNLTVDINSRTKNGTTPLKIAKHFKHDAVVKLLLERGAVDT